MRSVSLFDKLEQTARRLKRYAFSVPIFIKIIVIGFLVAVLFGMMAFEQIRDGTYRTHYQVQGETALFVSQSLAARIEPLVRELDKKGLDRELGQTMSAFPDVRYIVVQDANRKILSHGFTFPREAPPDLLEKNADLCAACHATLSPTEISANLIEVPPKLALPEGSVRAYERQQGLVLEVTAPIGTVGTVRLGVGNKIIARELASISRSLLLSLVLSLAVGLTLALVSAYVLIRPLHGLVQTMGQVGLGNFAVRATVFSDDEIGQLATAFNKMAESLESYRSEVQEKEAVQISLIGKIVSAQEEERRNVARELHDQLGQSLSSTLLLIESTCKGCPGMAEKCGTVKNSIRGLIDKVRQLAWDVRPSILDDYGIDSALARYVEEVSKRVPFRIDYQYVATHEMNRLPARIEVTLYRITQEAITNIIRHANATQTSVILHRQEYEVSLIVEDNGGGFDVAAIEKPSSNSLGIVGMKERAILVGGSFVVESLPGQGTTVRVIIPVTETSHGHKDSHS